MTHNDPIAALLERFNAAAALMNAGRRDDAVVAFAALCDDWPEDEETRATLAHLLSDSGRLEDAAARLAAAPTSATSSSSPLAAATDMLATAYCQRGRKRMEAEVAAAERDLRQALALAPDRHDVALVLAALLANASRFPEAAQIFAGATASLASDPAAVGVDDGVADARVAAETGWVDCVVQGDATPEEIDAAIAARWRRLAPLARPTPPWTWRPGGGAPLRVVVLSGWLDLSQLMGKRRLISQMAQDPRLTVTLIDPTAPDAVEKCLSGGFDLALDLDGPTAPTVGLLATRPAALVAAWLHTLWDYGGDLVDWEISDAFYGTPENRRSTARLWAMPGGVEAYPPENLGEPPPRRPQSDAAPLYACFNRPNKISTAAAAAFARIVSATPGARLLLASNRYDLPGARDHVARLMTEAGLPPHRLEIVGMVPGPERAALLAAADVALDCFPFNGGVTAVECLWSGLTYPAFLGDRPTARLSGGYLHFGGVAEGLLCADQAAWEARCIALGRDPAARAAYAASLRPRMAASPLCDSERLRRELTEALLSIARIESARLASTP